MQQPRHDLSTCRRSDKARRRPREGIGRDFLSEQGRRVALAELLGFAQVFLYALLPEEKLAPDRMIRSAASGGAPRPCRLCADMAAGDRVSLAHLRTHRR